MATVRLASDGEIDFATARPVVPLSTWRLSPSGNVSVTCAGAPSSGADFAGECAALGAPEALSAIVLSSQSLPTKQVRFGE